MAIYAAFVGAILKPNFVLIDAFNYSFDIGPAHFIVISTEFYFYTNYGWKQIHHQWNWLMNDLQV